MDADSSLPVFDNADSYLFLIDDELKTQIEGQPYVCVNLAHDVWMPLDRLSLESLKAIAVRCVHKRSLKRQLIVRFVGQRAFPSE